MKLPVYLYGHPVLRNISEPVDPNMEGIQELIAEMFNSMYESEGVGLAAPQIGKNIRLVVIDASPLGEDFEECKDRKMVLINPEIEILDGDKVSRAEGCLSLPGINENVPRVEHLRMKWTDEKGEAHDEEISGFLARIIQHECDHLEGKMFIDHIALLRKQMIKRKLENIAAGKIRVDYPVRFAPVRRR